MNRWEEYMVFYGHAHRHPVNIWIHVVGVPIIVGAVFTAAAWLRFEIAGVPVHGSWLLALAGVVFYFTLDSVFAAFLTPLLALLVVSANALAAYDFTVSAIFAAAGFFGGYAAQFVGHAIEGRKPSLFQSVWKSMVTAPLFFVAEIAKVLGYRKELFARVDAEIARRESVPL